jgi:hypothetical protein
MFLQNLYQLLVSATSSRADCDSIPCISDDDEFNFGEACIHNSLMPNNNVFLIMIILHLCVCSLLTYS